MKRSKIFNVIIAIFFMLGCIVSLSYAQAGRGTGRQKGTVMNEERKPVENASVILEFSGETGIKKEVKTCKDGKWTFVGLGSGEYKLTVLAEGYDITVKMIRITQMERNPILKIILRKPKKTKIKKTNELEIANAFFKEKKFHEALVLYQKLLEKNQDFYDLHISIGNCHKEKKEFEKAIDEYNKFLEKAKDNQKKLSLRAKALAAIGEIYIMKKDIEKAQKYFLESCELDPKDEILAYNVGEIFFSNYKTEEAIKYYSLSIKIKPKWAAPYVKLGYAYLNAGNIDKAIEYLNKYLELNPNASDAEGIKEVIKSLK